ncbi:MAG: hypothetical protein LBP73_04595 [Clostridiales Family XIII bacterium]|jgi:hypothetical protein|nr:hypothetical protein [Clostridiales Family XIII bacterium]
MKKLQEKLLDLEVRSYCAARSAKDRALAFAADERGDTNFISIIVVLGIALVVAGVFMGFKDQIIGKAKEIIDSFIIK